MVAIKWEAALAAATPPPLRPAAVLTSHTCSLLLPQGPPHPDLYGIPPPLPRRLQRPCWQRWWWRWRRAWAPSPPPPPLPPFPPLPPLRNQGLVGVTYSDAQSGVFLGSPSIARLDADTLLISHVSHLMRLLPCDNEFAHRMACTERSCHATRHFDTAEMPAASPANAALIQLVDLIQTRPCQDFFPEWGRTKRTSVYASKDGSTWHRRATVERQFWSTLFVHRGRFKAEGGSGCTEAG